MWWVHPYGFGFFPFVFPLTFFVFIALFFIVSRIIFIRRFRQYGSGCGGAMYGLSNQGLDAEVILKRRLARGDITEEEYQHLRDLVKD
ncbi:MAG: SHOCT domain-containing protein [Alicyclobacillaceae bacterium]|jgi:uncharacterized membrane protein|nr:SHOCT domain-containing protein [Alicyclobacillaceae bacterium]